MPVFDFNDVSDERNHAECTYTTFRSDAGEATPEQPILLLDNHSDSGASFHRCLYQPGETFFL